MGEQPAAVIGAGERRQLELERLGDGRLALLGDGLGRAGKPALFSRVD
ncbi:MAG: hypothetical protein MI919_35835 [Holophagales bacterium]|nr:hypothetical protein [Holophagales bacterium]